MRAPEETNRHIHRLNPEMDMDILAYGAEESRPLVLDPTARKLGLGTMSAERWETLLQQMIEAGLIQPGILQSTAAFTTRFLP